MLPVLFSINGYAISSLAVFLYLSFFVSLFAIWRLSQYYELDAEKTIDVFLITSFVSLLGARIYFIIFHLALFTSFSRMINIFHYPGYSFWGGLGAGILAVVLQSHFFKFPFRFVADFAIIGLLIGITISSFGCLLSGCQYGQVSSLPIAVTLVGIIGRRFPLQFVEGALFLILFYSLWKSSLRFHHPGVVAAKGLIWLGLLKLVLEQFRGDQTFIGGIPISLGTIFSSALFVWGIVFFYMVSKRSVLRDLNYLGSLFTNGKRRKLVISNLKKNWYNAYVAIKVSIPRWRKNLFKLLHVKANPTRF